MTDSFRDQMIAEIERQKVSVAEVARKAGVKYDVVRDLKRRAGSSTSVENARKISAALGFTYDSPRVVQDGDTQPVGADLIQVHDVSASAGYGAFVDAEDIAYSLAFPPGYLSRLTRTNPRDLSIISVRGDSMMPTLADDDVVMLDHSQRDLSYDGLFVIRDNGDALLVKRIGRAGAPGHVTVISDNRALYDPVEKRIEDIEVIGKVIWAAGKV